MTDIAGKSKFIEDFLEDVSFGRDFIQDIWINRAVERQGVGAEVTQANSFTKQDLKDIERLLEDDLIYCFDRCRFTFRFIAAIAGSGKTTLLRYLRELLKVKTNYSEYSVVIYLQLPELLFLTGNQSFAVKFYSRIIAQTLWDLLSKQKTNDVAVAILKEFFGNETFSVEFQNIKSFEGFFQKFNRLFTDGSDNFSAFDVFLYIIRQVIEVSPTHSFVYLIDELDDVLREDTNSGQQMRTVFRTLINKIGQDYGNKIRLMIYLAGTSDIMRSFITSDQAFEDRVSRSTINLVPGSDTEIGEIRSKIDDRIDGAYKYSRAFKEANQKIQNINFRYSSSNKSLRRFCQDYAGTLLEIYYDHFSSEIEAPFEGSEEQLSKLIEKICRDIWSNYLEDSKYTIDFEVSSASKDHTFNCYAKLVKDGIHVASAYGGARNYELLNRYVDEFTHRLEKSGFKKKDPSEDASDIAFIIAPSCSSLLEMKLEIKGIKWINSLAAKLELESEGPTQPIEAERKEKNFDVGSRAIDINTASKDSLLRAIGDIRGIGSKIIDEIIANRPYKDLASLAKVRNIGDSRKQKLQEKLDNGLICFKFGVFISYNRQDIEKVKEIKKSLEARGIAVWMDIHELYPGDAWQRNLEKMINSDLFKSVAIFIGRNDIGPWQEREIEAFIRKDVEIRRKTSRKEGYRIIPVKLRTRGNKPELPHSLEGYGAIDLNNRNPDPVDELVNSILRD